MVVLGGVREDLAEVLEMEYIGDSKSPASNGLRVQISSSAHGGLAQLVEALVLETKGSAFESQILQTTRYR